MRSKDNPMNINTPIVTSGKNMGPTAPKEKILFMIPNASANVGIRKNIQAKFTKKKVNKILTETKMEFLVIKSAFLPFGSIPKTFSNTCRTP